MVCRASWGERESGGGNDDENERTRLVGGVPSSTTAKNTSPSRAPSRHAHCCI